jgi:hypothetical protein
VPNNPIKIWQVQNGLRSVSHGDAVVGLALLINPVGRSLRFVAEHFGERSFDLGGTDLMRHVRYRIATSTHATRFRGSAISLVIP